MLFVSHHLLKWAWINSIENVPTTSYVRLCGQSSPWRGKMVLGGRSHAEDELFPLKIMMNRAITQVGCGLWSAVCFLGHRNKSTGMTRDFRESDLLWPAAPCTWDIIILQRIPSPKAELNKWYPCSWSLSCFLFISGGSNLLGWSRSPPLSFWMQMTTHPLGGCILTSPHTDMGGSCCYPGDQVR